MHIGFKLSRIYRAFKIIRTCDFRLCFGCTYSYVCCVILQKEFNTLISVAIGFVIGAYIPVSQFSDGVQTFVNLIPGSHIAAMIRNVLVSPCINDISTSLAGADHGMFAAEAEKAFATNLNLFGNEVDFTFMMMYSIGAILIFLILNLISYKFSSKRKD